MNFSQRYFPGLDGLRAASIFLVLLHHIGMIFQYWPFAGGPAVLSSLSFQVMLLGFAGVDMFFVISGFLIAGLLLEDLSGPLRIKRFYVRRAFKILPQYWTVVLVGTYLSFFVYEQRSSVATYLNYLFFLQNYFGQVEILRHLWTIAVEEHFYLLLPLVYWVIWLVFKNSEARWRALFVIFLVLIAAGNALRWSDFMNVGLDPINQPPSWQFTHRRFDALVFGCWLRLMIPCLAVLKEKFKIIPSVSFLLGCVLFSCLFLTRPFVNWQDYFMLYISCGFILLSVILDLTILVNILETPWLRFVGRNSYGIYIWHMMSIFFFSELFKKTNSVWFVLLYVIMSLVLGVLSTQTIEKTFLRIRKQVMP
ncbi:MAG: acyltransferase [Candidatus Omnitrophica bacterium]|nr:acyltransferase [Candidatus Omnitrophota bacterium]